MKIIKTYENFFRLNKIKKEKNEETGEEILDRWRKERQYNDNESEGESEDSTNQEGESENSKMPDFEGESESGRF